MSKHAIVKSSELGTNCWKPCRFVPGSRCNRVESCTYPEKKTCKAIPAEVDYLNARVDEIKVQSKARILRVTEYRDKAGAGQKDQQER